VGLLERKTVNRKNLALESSYGYLNIHLSLLYKAILENNIDEQLFQKSQLKKVRNRLIKLGYFERRK
jgi:hypothetical protein